MLRQAIEVERFDVGHGTRRRKSGRVRHRRARTQIEEHAVAANPPRTAAVERDFDSPRGDETAFAHDHFRPALRIKRYVQLMLLFYHPALAALNAFHADF